MANNDDSEFGFPFGRRFHDSLPRDELRMDGHNFTISATNGNTVRISDGERSAWYRPVSGPSLDTSKARIKVELFAAGMICEALELTLTDGEREVSYAPVENQELPAADEAQD